MAEDNGPVLSTNENVRQWRLHSPIDELREAMLGFDALYTRRDLRIQVLRNLSNPWPSASTGSSQRPKPNVALRLPEANAAPIPHSAFRRRIQLAMHDKEIRKILRLQLLRCERPNEIMRIMAVAMQNKVTAQNFAALAEPIIRALYRCRNNVTDPEVLKVLNVLLWRFKQADIPYRSILIHMGIKYAARSRSLIAMKKYLKLLRERGEIMMNNVFPQRDRKIQYRTSRTRRDSEWTLAKGTTVTSLEGIRRL